MLNRGSEWRWWEPHIHAPGTAMNAGVCGKPEIGWVIERPVANTDNASCVVKAANVCGIGSVSDTNYPLTLLLGVSTVSLKR